MLIEAIKKAAWDLGFDHCALAPLQIPERDQAAYLDWVAAGSAGEMSYMSRDPAKRTHPSAAFPDARVVLTLGVSYYQGPFPEKPGPGYGRVARYAWGLDYHTVIMERLEKLLANVREILGDAGAASIAIDTKPLLERSLAEQAGLGFVGKNTLLIMPRSGSLQFHVGSWIFLAEILLNVQTEPVEKPALDAAGKCGRCNKCLTACPTDAFDGPYRLRANKCISYLTIENKGSIPIEMRAQLGDWLFGCDVCQEVCPFNARSFETRWPELKADRGVGPWVPLQEILELPVENFKARFGNTPLSRPKRRGLVRNACVAAGNSGDGSLAPALEKLISDPEPLVREHAAWALERLSA